jgi:uncharacterized membrane protein
VSASLQEFNRGTIRPMECLKGGWALIKGEYWLFLGITFVGFIIGGTVPLGILMGPMMCGIYLCFLRRMRGERVEFSMLFKGFDSFGDGVIAGLVQVIPVIAMFVPLYIAFMVGITMLAPERGSRRTVNDPNAMITFLIIMGVTFVVVLLFATIISMLFMFSYPLIVDRKLSGFNAVKTSARAVFGNLGGVLGLMMLNVVLGIIGMLMCYIGALFFMPIGMAAWAIAYRQVFPESQSFSGGI